MKESNLQVLNTFHSVKVDFKLKVLPFVSYGQHNDVLKQESAHAVCGSGPLVHRSVIYFDTLH